MYALETRGYLARARARARARPSRAGGLRPLPRKGTGDLPDGARAFIFERVIVGEIMKIVQFPIRNRSFSSDHVKKRAKIVQNERG